MSGGMGGMGLGYLGDLFGIGSMMGGSPADLQNMYSKLNAQQAAMMQQQHGAMFGFDQAWHFHDEKMKPPGPEEYGPFRPSMPQFRYETSYSAGRDNCWMTPLSDPGAKLLKVCGYLAVYPAIYLLIELLKGLFNAF